MCCIFHGDKNVQHKIDKITMKFPSINFKYNVRGRGDDTRPASVLVVVTHERKRAYFNSGVKVLAYQWRNGKVVRHPEAEEMNKHLNKFMGDIIDRTENLWQANKFSLDNLRSVVRQNEMRANDPLKWFERTRERLRIAHTTYKAHKRLYDALECFGKFVTWEDFTTANIVEFDYWLRKNTKVKLQASLANYHKNLKSYLKKAEAQGLIKDNPYNRFKIERGSTSVPRYLNDTERKQIEDVSLTPTLDRVRDMFVLMMYTGLAYADMAKLKKEDIKEENGKFFIVDSRQKTGNKYRLTLLPKVMDVLNKYNFSLPVISNVRMNIYLKLIAGAAGIDKNLTCHVARHTFATWALKSGVSIEVVSKMLAHKDIKTTQIYAKILQEEVDKGFDMLLDK